MEELYEIRMNERFAELEHVEYNKHNWNNKKFVLDHIKRDPKYLQYASEDLKNDKEIIFEAVKFNGY